MPLYRIVSEEPLVAPALVAAFDGWVDAGDCGTTAAAHIARGGEVIATFDSDVLIDYRARRPVLDIVDGRVSEITWPNLSVWRMRHGDRDLLVLTGPEPDYRWQEFGRDLLDLAQRLRVVESVSLGAIGAAVPHTRPTPVLMTGTHRTPSDADPPLPAGQMRVPAAAVSLVELNLEANGIPSVGFWAQAPHYVSGPYVAGALALVERVIGHLGVPIPVEKLAAEARRERARLDEIVAEREEAREYVQRLEEMGQPDAVPAPPDGDIAAEVERFLKDITGESRDQPPTDG